MWPPKQRILLSGDFSARCFRNSEFYPVPASAIYRDPAELAGSDALTAKARSYLDDGQPVEALHMIDIVLEQGDNCDALLVRRDALAVWKKPPATAMISSG